MWEKVERGCSHRAVTRLGWGKDKVCETCKWASDPIWTFRKKIKNLSSVNFFFFFLLNWRIIALQCCAGLCNKPMQISHNYICVLCTLGKTNEAGQRQKEFCPEKALVIANTLFQQHKRWRYTWTSDAQHWNQIDYILCSRRWRSSIQWAKTRLEADSDSDHELHISKFRLKMKKVGEKH